MYNFEPWKKPGTALDDEASQRGTSVYLADNRIDMVPMLLSSNLCSLRGGEERLAFSVIWELDENADVLKTRFTKSGEKFIRHIYSRLD